jgi:arsenate reductase
MSSAVAGIGHGAREVIQRDMFTRSRSETLKRHGIDPGQPRSKSWDEFAHQFFDLVITVCDQAAGESCPLFSGNPKKLHWSTPDPAKATGSVTEIEAAFDHAFLMLKNRIQGLVK